MELTKTTIISNFLPTNIRYLRKRLNISQEELASKVGLNRGNIASYENGTAEPKICNLVKLSNLFGITIIDLTQSNLKEEHDFQIAKSNFQRTLSSEKELLEQFVIHAKEIEVFIESIYRCQKFKVNKMEEIPADMKFAFFNFDEIHQASMGLLSKHKALIDLVLCKMK